MNMNYKSAEYKIKFFEYFNIIAKPEPYEMPGTDYLTLPFSINKG